MQRIPLLLTIITITLIGVGYVLTCVSDAATQIAQAQAAVEAARAAQDAAKAAQIAGRGLSTVSTIQAITLLSIVIAVLAIAGTLVYMLYERRNHNKQLAAFLASQPRHQWAPGPNAGWKKLDDAHPRQQLGLQDAITVAALSLMTNMAQTLQGNRPQPPAYPLVRAPRPHRDDMGESNTPEAFGFLDQWPASQTDERSDWDMFVE